jgi:F1F0 ATPase subunit 2
MTEALTYLLAVIAGVIASLLYIGGLWVTVRRLPTSSRPVLLLAVSFLLRVAAVLALFYVVARTGLLAMAVAVFVFVFMRFLLTHRWGLRAGRQRSHRGSHPDAG